MSGTCARVTRNAIVHPSSRGQYEDRRRRKHEGLNSLGSGEGTPSSSTAVPITVASPARKRPAVDSSLKWDRTAYLVCPPQASES